MLWMLFYCPFRVGQIRAAAGPRRGEKHASLCNEASGWSVPENLEIPSA